MADRIDSPYVGLVPYREADARFFFGRERDVRKVIAQMFAARLTLLYGASGVGKSSLLRAGVVSELKRRADEAVADGERPDVEAIYVNRWQGNPLASVRAAVVRTFGSRLAAASRSTILDESSLKGLVARLVVELDTDVFLIFDQFEEFFLYHARRGEPGPFERDLADLATRPGLPVNLTLSLRDDALSRLDHFKGLIPNLFANYIRVTHLSRDDARRAIVEPVTAYNALPAELRVRLETIEVESELVEDVIEGVLTGRVAVGDIGRGQVTSSSAGVETPYLQLVMTELWRYEGTRGSAMLRADTLRNLGGAEAIVQRHLDTTMAQLEEADRVTCARMFQYLVTPSGTKIAYTSVDLAGLVDRTADEIEVVLAKLSGSGMRILSPVAPPIDRPAPVRYEIYHDSLAQAILDWRRRFVAEQEKAELERERAEQERELQEELASQRLLKEQAERVAAAERARAEAEADRVAEHRAAARRLKVIAAVALAFAAGAIAAGAWAWIERQGSIAVKAEYDSLQVRSRDLATAQEALIQRYESALDTRDAELRGARAALEAKGAKVPAGGADAREIERLRQEFEAYKAQLARLNKQAAQISDTPGTNPEDARVREALSRYAAAHNNPNVPVAVQQMRAVFPAYDAQQWARARRGYESYSMSLQPVSAIGYSPDGQTATLVAASEQNYQMIGGSHQQRAVQMRFRLTRGAGGWTISSAEVVK